jgi:hypothetical protein
VLSPALVALANGYELGDYLLAGLSPVIELPGAALPVGVIAEMAAASCAGSRLLDRAEARLALLGQNRRALQVGAMLATTAMLSLTGLELGPTATNAVANLGISLNTALPVGFCLAAVAIVAAVSIALVRLDREPLAYDRSDRRCIAA